MLLTLNLIVFLGVSWAQAPVVNPFDEPEEADLFTLDERMVTAASRYAQTTREAPAIVTVVTDAEIRRRGFTSLAELLRSLTGIHITRSFEGRSLAWFRGIIATDNNKFLLMVDGVPWYDGVYNHAWIDEYIPLALIKQVEVIKGPGSVMYGTNAFSGVVNVVTYSPQDMKDGFVRTEGGSNLFRAATVIGGGSLGPDKSDAGFVSWARVYDSTGDGLENNPKGEHNVRGARPYRGLNAGLRINVGGFELHFDHVDHLHTYYTNGQNNLVDVLLEAEDQFNLAYHNDYLYARWKLSPTSEITVAPFVLFQEHDNPGLYAYGLGIASQNDESGEEVFSLTGTLVETEKHSRRYSAGLELEARPAYANVVVAGLGAETVQVVAVQDIEYPDLSGEPLSPSAFQASEDSTISNLYAYVQDTWTARGWLELVGGIRADLNLTADYFFTSPRAGILIVPTTTFSTKLLYGRAFRAPTARELLVQVAFDETEGDYPYTNANSGLEPEVIDTLELEGTWAPAQRSTFRATVFSSLVRRTIDKRDTPPNEYINKNSGTQIAGGEAEWNWQTSTLETSLAYSLMLGRDLETGFAIYGAPIQLGDARISWSPVQGLWVSALSEFVGPQPRAQWTPDSRRPDGEMYTLLHAGLSTHLPGKNRTRLDFRCRNLLDTEYDYLLSVDRSNDMTSAGEPKYPRDLEAEGRSFHLGIEMDF
ncbi:MAG: TonB-dependent receptor [Myxococcota bacterium]|nr:TonB-dependent receptor [Myxococcota bacterium]